MLTYQKLKTKKQSISGYPEGNSNIYLLRGHEKVMAAKEIEKSKAR